MTTQKVLPNDLIDSLLSNYQKPEDLIGENGLLKQLTKALVERALQAEMTEHLGHDKHEPVTNRSGNARNGKSRKTLKGEFGELPIEIPRDREGSFEPQLIPKHQTRWTGFDDKIISLYSRGMTVREIQSHLSDMYGTEVSPTLISSVTDAVSEEVTQWQSRPLDPVYPVVYLDCIHVKVRDAGAVRAKAVYLAIGINMEGQKEVLGLWIAQTEGAKFWLGVVTELKNRGVQDIFIACVDGLKGFPEAIEAVYPKAAVQLCIVHMVRNSLNYVGWNKRAVVATDLKRIYTAATSDEAEQYLGEFEAKWGDAYPPIAASWWNNWSRITPFFDYPPEIRRIIYTTNAIESALKSIGMKAVLEKDASLAEGKKNKQLTKTNWWLLGISGTAAVLAEIIDVFPHQLFQFSNKWIVISLVFSSILSGGLTTYKKGWIALRNGNLNINALMSIAVTGAMAIGSWPEAAMVMFLFSIAEVIEAKSLDRARNAISGLLDLTPEIATVLQADGSWLSAPVKTISLGAIIQVRPGERIALDGVVVSGNSTVNQAPITGESLPIDKTQGDTVFAGTINQSGSFQFKVTAESAGSTLARIIHAVESAQGSRAPTQRFVDQFAKIYTPTIFSIALLVALVPPLAFGSPWHDWFYKALVMLVIACPCALVISTPVTIVSGLAAAARKGILIKGGAFLEAGRHMKVLALDKTGTITHGKPKQTDLIIVDGEAAHIHQTAASLASRSDHPVSLAIAQNAVEKSISLIAVENFEAIFGRGVRGVIEGKMYQLGNHRLIEELGLCSSEIEAQLLPLEQQGKTVVMLANESKVLAIFAVADTVKDASKHAIQDLHHLGIRTMMLTGDNAYTAAAIGKEVGVDLIRGNLLPEDKLKIVDELLVKNPMVKVGMVGDGVNDAPALARASIGFAMGVAGTDTAIEAADVALMDDDLRKVPTFVRLSQSTANILFQNIALALGIKGIFLVLTFTGQATMWMAVFADMGASLLVVANGLRLLRK